MPAPSPLRAPNQVLGPSPTKSRPALVAWAHGLGISLAALVGILVVQLTMRAALLADLRTYLGRTADVTAALIDIEAAEGLVDSSQTQSVEYLSAVRPLEALLKSNPDIRFAYTGRIRGDSMFFVLDGERPPARAHVMESATPTEGELEVVRTGLTVIDERPSATAWGEGIRAFSPLRTASGGIAGFVGVTMSASQYRAWLRRLDQAALFGFGASVVFAIVFGLRTLRSERVRARAERAILEAKELADHMAKVKSQFVANVSHEIRTPLNGVLGFGELLATTALDAEQRSYVDSMRASGATLLGMVNDVLDFSKLEAGRVFLEVRDTRVRAIVQEVSQLFGAQALASGLELSCDVDSEIPDVIRADPTRLRQVLVNLAGNAVKFTPSGSVRIVVGLETIAARERLVVRVIDSGIGIAEAKWQDVFESFAQADGSTARHFGGTGLGLAICREIVHLMDGEIGVESREGVGSTFWFWVPLVRVGAQARPRDPAIAARGVGTTAMSGTL